MQRTGWSLKVAIMLALASMLWAGAASIAARSIESRVREGAAAMPRVSLAR